jgi:hypothetical protein
MADEKHDILFKVDDNISDVLKRLEKMSKHLDNIQGGFEDISDITSSDLLKGIEKMEKQMSSFHNVVESAVKDSDFGNNFKKAAKDVSAITANYNKLRQAQEEYQQAASEGNSALAKEKEEQYKNTAQAIRKEKKAVLASMEDQSKKIQKIFVEDQQALAKILNHDLPEDLGKGIGSAIKSALSGDLGGIISGLTEGAGTAAKYGGGRARNALDQRGLKKEMSLGVPGGGKMGGVTKALGGVARFLGPLAAAVGGVGMIVKLLFDAEAQTKDLNKSLMDQVPYYALAVDGFDQADRKLEQMRESATDFATNMRLGLDPKQHYEVIAALNEHGADLRALELQYDSFGEMASDVVETVRVASLNLGVSMGEVSQYIAQMQDLHGKSMSDIKTDLSLIAGLAQESGVSTKKFFGTISQLTGQMGLYNFKLEDAGFLLSQMNKVMDSKSADAFTTKMVTGLKEMNAQQKMQTIMLAGQGKVRGMLEKASAKMFANMEDEAGAFKLVFNDLFKGKFGPIENMEDLKNQVSKMNRNDKNMLIASVQQEIGEEASRELSNAIKMLDDAKKGGLSMVDALNNLGGLDSMEIQISALENVFGSIENVPSILAEQLGIGQDELKQMQRFSEVSKGNYALLKNQISMDKAAGKSSEEIATRMAQMSEKLGYGIKYDEQTGKLLDQNGNVVKDQYDLLGAMKDEQKEKIEESADMQMSAAERQVVATQSVTDILKHLIADLLNTIGNQLTGINTLVMQIARKFGGVSQERVDRAEALSNVSDARSLVMRLEREKKKAQASGDTGRVSQIDEDLVSARGTLDKRRKSLDFLMENRNALYTEDGKKKSNYDDDMALKGEMEGLDFKGTTSDFHRLKNKTLEDAHHAVQKSGVSVNDDSYDAKVASLAKQQLEETIAANKLYAREQDIQAEILEAFKKDTKENKSINETTQRILGEKGIELSDKALSEFKQQMVAAEVEAARAKEFMKAGFSPQASQDLARAMSYGDKDDGSSGMNMTEAHLKERYGVKNVTAKMRAGFTEASQGGRILPTTHDAKIMTKGVAPLKFMPGDLVVRQDSLAKTMTGGPGAFAGQVANQLTTNNSGGSEFNMNVHIHNPTSGQTQNEIMKAYEAIKRKETGG